MLRHFLTESETPSNPLVNFAHQARAPFSLLDFAFETRNVERLPAWVSQFQFLLSAFESLTATENLQHLQSLSNPANVAGMARFGIHATKVYGVSLPQLKRLTRQVGKDHLLAQALWSSGAHEARLVACFIESPAEVTSRQMDRWAGDFDNWPCVMVVGCICLPKSRLRNRRLWFGVSGVGNWSNAQALS